MEFTGKSDGFRLRKARRRMGLSRADVMRALKLNSISCISDWENNRRKPSLENAIRLARVYKVLVQDLFQDIDRQAVSNVAQWMNEVDGKKKIAEPNSEFSSPYQ